jgi:membrane protease YdiL (CAAX protease family)
VRRAFRLTFWEGALYGFGGVTLLLSVTRLFGYYSFGTMALQGGATLRWGALYLLAFLGVALMEEYTFRGYSLFTLSTGIGFWPAVLVIAALFGYAHKDNRGETYLGIANLVLYYLVFCFVLRRTGDLWMAVGFHTAWNWAEAFFYGLPDSGILAQTRLLAPAVHGPDVWTGGSAGPEASVLDPLVLLLVAVAVHLRYPTARTPDAEIASARP